MPVCSLVRGDFSNERAGKQYHPEKKNGSRRVAQGRHVAAFKIRRSILGTFRCRTLGGLRADWKSTVQTRWDEKAGLRTGCGVRSQVIDVLKAHSAGEKMVFNEAQQEST